MSNVDERIGRLLAVLKADGRASPAGWQQFYSFLKERRLADQEGPPVPLILAASSESANRKHGRLADQLRWANENRCFDEAISYLRDIPSDKWDFCSEENWFQDSYPS